MKIILPSPKQKMDYCNKFFNKCKLASNIVLELFHVPISEVLYLIDPQQEHLNRYTLYFLPTDFIIITLPSSFLISTEK